MQGGAPSDAGYLASPSVEEPQYAATTYAATDGGYLASPSAGDGGYLASPSAGDGGYLASPTYQSAEEPQYATTAAYADLPTYQAPEGEFGFE